MRNHRPHWAQSTGPRPGFILIKYALPWLRVVSARDGGLRCSPGRFLRESKTSGGGLAVLAGTEALAEGDRKGADRPDPV